MRKIHRNEAEKKLNEEIGKQKAFEPIIKGLKNVEEAVIKTHDDIKSFLVPVKPLTQTSDLVRRPNHKKMIRDGGLETEIKNSIINNKIGVIAAHYLPKLSDDKFGIFHNHETNMHMIEEGAGNNNFHNENLGIIHFVKYLIFFIASLPKKVITGSGLVNNFLNSKIMPEIHWPGYNYLRPFTKSKKPINKLDEAAMELFTMKNIKLLNLDIN
ncbi:Hypothetical protein CINCED_3A008365 [Cinara cedri]|uniref:Uncharacterized protein n=1 Tax=Cinara cedri TaxID=506608 RepID=A0A5E4NPA7_9HEMI|nr:Hypothetical protein CINCED_3A008365 [Cinara cedri]